MCTARRSLRKSPGRDSLCTSCGVMERLWRSWRTTIDGVKIPTLFRKCARPGRGTHKSMCGAEFHVRGYQIRHLARIFTVDNEKNGELNSFRRVSTLICRASASMLDRGDEETLPRS